jgi:hypothetical protein
VKIIPPEDRTGLFLGGVPHVVGKSILMNSGTRKIGRLPRGVPERPRDMTCNLLLLQTRQLTGTKLTG